MNNKITYTSVFGGYDDVKPLSLPQGWDFKLFSEKNSLSLYKDSNRNAKKYKLLPHRYLSEYEYSLWVDGNFTVVGNIDILVEKYLKDSNIAFFNHQNTALDPRNCIYEEAEFILAAGERNYALKPSRGILAYKDNPNTIRTQMEKYQKEGYPANNGLIKGGIILRRHNEKDVIDAMESWWEEVKYNSKRDQLSFNYIEGDLRNNEFFTHSSGHIGKK